MQPDKSSNNLTKFSMLVKDIHIVQVYTVQQLNNNNK